MSRSESQEWNGSNGQSASASTAGYTNGTIANGSSNNSHRPKQPTTTDFEGTIEKLLSQVEPREPQLLKPNELQILSQLCAIQSNMQEATHFAINNDLGFADVHVDWMAQLVSILEGHVKEATSTNAIQLTYQASMSIKNAKSNNNGANVAKVKGA
eukprot:CAMPEP_0113604568 /NCGR_PEP_ID=MMETSP0017_2-20120614/1861_1 /TAXON_ID=2856 /ORGANISM="Cylindrotheca closterium" /LENGTH=155 /DNA_ID=CAMNT_0000512995 /DNA_START=164 /DNA_END=627 /DNA_ORIENTATION=+ /assembly_acc=CAM_ASM_000147